MTQTCPRNQNEYLAARRLILSDMIREMTTAQLHDSISHNLVTLMIPHHRAAAAMSQNLLLFCREPELRALAGGILSTQTTNLAEMEHILPACSAPVNTPCQLCLCQIRLNQIMEKMFSQMTRAEDSTGISTAFLRQMIAHHEGAALMCENALHCNICPDLSPVLEHIILSQQQETRQMRRLLQET